MRRPAPDLLELWARCDPSVAHLAQRARAQVLTRAPACWELIYDTYATSVAFAWSDRLRDAFCHLVVYPSGKVNLGFNDGAHLADPGGLLQGTGKRIRHVKLQSLAALDDPRLDALIDEAVSLAAARHSERGAPARPGRALRKTA